jgi:hypothetical protein
MNTLNIEQIGLAAYLIMNETDTLVYKGYSQETRSFIFESDNNEEYWANSHEIT